ncbi:MAG: PDZ domain-containing protein [Acidobacteriota bacterium]
MRRILFLVLTLMAISIAASLFAGEKHGCAASADECLKKMVQSMKSSGWLGISTEKSDGGKVVIARVDPDSPAQRAGFQTGDVLFAINGVAIGEENKAELKKVKQGMTPGSEVRYTVIRKGGRLELSAALVEVPREVLAQRIGEHMLAEHLATAVAVK